ncbi:MAG: hypothetical protein JWO19_5866 [Bryobacterales bacterium]|nr:hypothetical protein [Bryobacterales bacterium]
MVNFVRYAVRSSRTSLKTRLKTVGDKLNDEKPPRRVETARRLSRNAARDTQGHPWGFAPWERNCRCIG